MAFIKNLLLIVAVVTLPSVENAPSNIMKKSSKEENTESRLVFRDGDAEDQNSRIPAYTTLPPTLQQPQRSDLTGHKIVTKSTQEPLEVKSIQPSGQLEMDDERRIWGIAVDNKDDVIEDESLYNRPLVLPKSVDKIKPSQAKTRNIAKVLIETDTPKPTACDMAIMICCGNSKLRKCFNSLGCPNVMEHMFSELCSSDYINKILINVAKYYKGNK